MSRFGNIFEGAKSEGQGEGDRKSSDSARADFWDELERPTKKPTTRVNFDLDADIDRRLTQKAFDLGISKSELLRKMVLFLLG